MSDTATKEPQYGVLTDDGIDRLRQRIGIHYRVNGRVPHNYEVNWDGIRHFSYGCGDGNPLFCEPEYGKSTRWGGMIAPPTFIYTMGEYDAPLPTPEEKALLKGDPLVGLGSYQAVMDFEWWRPLQIGDRQNLRVALLGVKVHEKSQFAGRTVSEITGFVYSNQNGELTSIRRGTWIRAERSASAKSKKPVQLPEPYSPEQLAEIDAAYDAETIRGAEPRYFEDVKIGDELPRIVRGPLRTSDIIAWHLGWGMQLTPPGAFGLSYKTRKKVPGMYPPNALNVPDTVQRLHWDGERAREIGVPLSYDYGAMRETFLANIVTNWIGDDGWLWKLSCQHRKFVYTGDTYWISGKVVDLRQIDGRNEVHFELWVENQWGVTVSPATAVALLPTRDAPVALPTPSAADVDTLIRNEVASYA